MKTLPRREWLLGGFGAGLVVVAALGTLGCQSESEVSARKESASIKPEIGGEAEKSPPALPDEHATDQQKISALTEAMVGRSVAVQGEIVKQCPASGCWFQVQDETGEMFVDLNASEIRLTESVVGQQAEVSGRLVKLGGELQLEAEHVEFAPEK